jgi:endonuclease YncB( thermonuclease family)
LLPVLAYALTGKVIAVADGDTITVLDKNNQETKIRLYGVDCPEKSQDFGTKAKQFTANMVFGKIVEVKEIDRDRYGRTVGIVLIEEKTLNAEILKSGLAWVYSRYCNQAFCSDWQVIQNVAKKARIGLWSHPNPVPPWEYRKSGKSLSESEKTPQADSGLYHGNSKSHVFHRKECRYFNCKNCTVIFQNRQEAIQAGFKPCGVCRP